MQYTYSTSGVRISQHKKKVLFVFGVALIRYWFEFRLCLSKVLFEFRRCLNQVLV